MSSYLVTLVEWMGAVAVTLLLSLSPAFQRRRPVKFVYAQREGIISLALFALIVLIQVFAFPLGARAGAALNGITPPISAGKAFSFTTDDLLRQAAFSAAALAPFLLALAVRRQPLLSAGLSRRALRPGLELGVALGLITIFLTNRTYTLMNGLTTPQGLYFAAALVGAFAEEFIFRGYIQLRLMDWLGETWGWLGAAVLFALWRVPQALAAGTTGIALAASLAALLLFGLLLGWIMRRSGSILATALYHAVHNWILIL